MSERDGFDIGVPCWIDTWQPDGAAAARFYAGLLGWEMAEPGQNGADAPYVMCRLRGRDVAAIGDSGAAPGPASEAAWTTYVRVEDVDTAAALATDAGGSLIHAPFDSLEGGRIAILADPAGATFGVWQPGAHGGAQIVNEAGAWTMSVLLCDEPTEAAAFYAAVFGWTGDPFPLGDDQGTLWRLEGYVGGEPDQPVPRDVVGVMAPAHGQPASWIVGFWVPDVDAAEALAPELGGTVIAGASETALGDARIADPGGAVFSVSPAPTAPPAAA